MVRVEIGGESITVKEFLLVLFQKHGHPVLTRFVVGVRVGDQTTWVTGNLGGKLVAGKDAEKARGRLRFMPDRTSRFCWHRFP